MTKQEEIREGMRKIPTENGWGSIKELCLSDRAISLILKYLHSQGVMIKVDRELPLYGTHQNPISPKMFGLGRKVDAANDGMQYLSEASYVVVEPLIEEKANGK